MTIKHGSDWDLSIENREGQLVLVVELKRKSAVSPEWVAQLRRNLLARGTFPKTPYLLMVFPDTLYLWSGAEAYPDYTEPTYAIDASPILQPYFEGAGVTADQISEASLELIVASWLEEIIHADQLPRNIDNSQQWLVDSGLYTALAEGKLVNEANVLCK